MASAIVKSEGENTVFRAQWDRSGWSRRSGEGCSVTEAMPELDCVTILAGEVTFSTETLLVPGYLNTDSEELRSPWEKGQARGWPWPEERLASQEGISKSGQR